MDPAPETVEPSEPITLSKDQLKGNYDDIWLLIFSSDLINVCIV